MSGRTILRLVLGGLLSIVCAVSLGAQYPTGTTSTPSAKPMPDKLAGTWYRQIDGVIVAATFAGDELKMCVTINADGALINLTLIADYAVTKDGLVHGAISGVDWNVKPKEKDEQSLDLEALAGSRAVLETLIDCPFSFRTRSTSAGLMVSNIKLAVDDETFGKTAKLFGGMFTFCKDGIVPTPKPAKTTTTNGGMTLPSARYVEHYPQYFPPDPIHPLPQELANMEYLDGKARRAGLSTTNTPPPTPTPESHYSLPDTAPYRREYANPQPPCAQQTPPVIAPTVQSYTPATAPIQQTAGSAPVVAQPPPEPDPATVVVPPPPRAPLNRDHGSLFRRHDPPAIDPNTVPVVAQPPATPLPAAVAKPGIVGTWYREFGSKLCVIKIAPDYMTMTVIMSGEVEGKIATATCVTTADYHITRDGMTLVGLITGVDAQIDDDLPEDDVKRLGEMVEKDRKIKEDRPFALTFRVYGDSLVIRNVRMPESQDEDEDNPLKTTFGGTYKNAGDKPLPKPKVVKANQSSSDPNIRMQELLYQSEDLRQIENKKQEAGTSPGTPRMVEPTTPVPTMPKPVPPGNATPPSIDGGTTTGLTPASPVEPPKIDTKKTQNQPSSFFPPKSKQAPDSKITPERIHGGIIRLVPRQPDAVPIAGAMLP